MYSRSKCVSGVVPASGKRWVTSVTQFTQALLLIWSPRKCFFPATIAGTGSSSHGENVMFVRVLVAMMIGLATATGLATGSSVRGQAADTSGTERVSATCDAPVKATLDPRYRLDHLAEHPLPLTGQFPDDPSQEAVQPVTYEVRQITSERDPQAPLLVINDTPWVYEGTYWLEGNDEIPRVADPELASVVDFLTLWSKCSQEVFDGALFSLLTDFGFGWVCSPGDPFMALRSPVSGLCPGGSLSQTQGALPLELYDARYLSANRIGIVVGDGSYRDDSGKAKELFVLGSISVLVQTPDGWRVDAIVGLVQIASRLPYIEIPVG